LKKISTSHDLAICCLCLYLSRCQATMSYHIFSLARGWETKD
jgi:hypothetical protein